MDKQARRSALDHVGDLHEGPSLVHEFRQGMRPGLGVRGECVGAVRSTERCPGHHRWSEDPQGPAGIVLVDVAENLWRSGKPHPTAEFADVAEDAQTAEAATQASQGLGGPLVASRAEGCNLDGQMGLQFSRRPGRHTPGPPRKATPVSLGPLARVTEVGTDVPYH